MTEHIVLQADETRRLFKQGVDKVVDTVKVTLGAGGRNVLLLRDDALPIITKDGVSVVRNIQDDNPFVNAGCMAVKSVAVNTVNLAGDGTTQSSLLTQAIVNASQEELKNENSYNIKRGIDLATKDIVKHLKQISKGTHTYKQMRQIAEVSSNGDKEISKLILTALKKVGKDGIIDIEKVDAIESSVEVSSGYVFDRPISDYRWVTNHAKITSELDNALVLLYEGDIETSQEIIDVIESISEGQSFKDSLLIIADNVSMEVENFLLAYKAQGFKFLYVKSPEHGSKRTETMLDIASVIGAKVYTREEGLHTVERGGLGQVSKVIVDVNTTTLIGGKGVKEVVENRKEIAKQQLKNYKGIAKDRDYIKKRIAKLSGGAAIIRVGGFSEVESREKEDRVDDALRAVMCSLEEGFIAGAGTTYLQCAKHLETVEIEPKHKAGYRIMIKALKEPFNQIYKNAEVEYTESLYNEILNNYGTGLDIETGETINLFERGIIDPAKVARVAIENSSSVASTFLTVGASVFNSEPIVRPTGVM